MDPISWINAGSSLLSALKGGAGAPAPGYAPAGNAPSVATTDADFSGFTVATGNARADGARISKTSRDGIDTPGVGFAGAFSDVSPAILIGGAVALAVLWRIFKK